MADPKGYMKSFEMKVKIWRYLGDAALFIAFAAALASAVPFALFPAWMFSESQIKPTEGSRTMAWIVLFVTLVLLVVILRQRFQFTRESLRSEQKVELWGGATGLFVLFTMADNVKEDAMSGLFGALGLILLLAVAVLLEPLALELAQREEVRNDAEEENRHKELLDALSRAEDPATEGASSGMSKNGCRLFRRRGR